MESFSHLELCKELHRRAATHDPIAVDLHGRLVRAIPGIDRILRQIAKYHSQFTDHSIDHSARIVRNIGCLLHPWQIRRHDGDDRALSSIDLFLLVAAALVHDIGMVVPDEEVRALVADGARCEELPPRDDKDDTWVWHGVSRLQIAEMARRSHPQRTLRMILDRRFVPASLIDEAPVLSKYLGLVAAGHGMDFEQVADASTFPVRVEIQVGGALQEECNPRFVAICLRLGDLLDLGNARACPILRGLSEPLNATSKAHWDQYKDIAVAGLKPSSDIALTGTCPTQEAERVLREWFSWLRNESGEAVHLQNTDDERYRLAIGRVRYEVEPARGKDGRYLYEFLEFRLNLDERQVFERLFGKALYGRTELAIRELVQNAIDAQRARILYELTNQSSWDELSSAEKDEHFTTAVRRRSDSMPIRIQVHRVERGKEGGLCLTISDAGIGMSRETIANYLLKVGRSRWTSDSLTNRLGIGSKTIGTFGIGFVSALMIADRISVDTRSCLPNEKPIAVTIFGWQGFASTTPGTRVDPGTDVSLLLTSNELADIPELRRLVSQQLPAVDFPVEITFGKKRQVAARIKKSKGSRQTTFPLDACGSTVTLRDVAHGVPVTQWDDGGTASFVPALCQDGIAVSAVRAPVMDWTWARVLSEFGLLLDLRGSSRVPLDLSRNLIEGDIEAFWGQTVPKVWSAILKACDVDRTARRAVQVLVETAFLEKRLPPLILQSDGTLASGVEGIKGEHTIRCLDVSYESWTREELTAVWLCPPAVHFDPILIDRAYQDLIHYDDDDHDYDDYDDGDESDDGDDGDDEDADAYGDDDIGDDEENWFVAPDEGRAQKPSVERPAVKTVIRSREPEISPRVLSDIEQDERRRRRFTSNVLSAWRRILQNFDWVSTTDGEDAVLSRTPTLGAVRWATLLSFPINRSWRSFAVKNGIVLYPAEGIKEQCERARDLGLTLADFLVYLSHQLEIAGSGWNANVLEGRLLKAEAEVLRRMNQMGVRSLHELDEDELEQKEKRERQSEKREASRWAESSSLPFLSRNAAGIYRGIARAVGLEDAVLSGDCVAHSYHQGLSPKRKI